MKKVSTKERKENIFRFFCTVVNCDPKSFTKHDITDEMVRQFDHIILDVLHGSEEAVVVDFYGLSFMRSESLDECCKNMFKTPRELYTTLACAHHTMEIYGLSEILLDWYNGYFSDTLEGLESKLATLNEELELSDEDFLNLWYKKGGVDFYVKHKDDGVAYRLSLREHLLYEICAKRISSMPPSLNNAVPTSN